MLRERVITALVLLPIGIFVVFTRIANGLPAFLCLLIISLVISFEIFSLMERRGYRFYVWINSISVTLSFIAYYLFGLGIYDVGYLFTILITIITLFCLIILIIESTSGNFESSMENIGISLFGFIILGVFAPLMGLIKMMDISGWLLAILAIITFLTDTGGLLLGNIFGKHKIPFLSSPNKTVEGYIGSFLFGFIAATACFIIQKIFALSTNFSVSEMFIISLSVILASIIGDLGESTIKRWSHSKDSGDLLPGHGGFFDRFDSILFSAPVFYVILKFMGY